MWHDRNATLRAGDDVDGLRLILETHLVDVVIEVVSCVALFSGRALDADAGPAR